MFSKSIKRCISSLGLKLYILYFKYFSLKFYSDVSCRKSVIMIIPSFPSNPTSIKFIYENNRQKQTNRLLIILKRGRTS